jgi:hypothetical protein
VSAAGVTDGQGIPRQERQFLSQLLGRKTRSHVLGNCIYCGTRCYGRTCDAHRDLPQLEAEELDE